MPPSSSLPSRREKKEGGGSSRRETDPTLRVNRELAYFRDVCHRLTQHPDPRRAGAPIRRVDLTAIRMLKDQNRWPDDSSPLFGHVPGVDIGFRFLYRAELALLRLHRPPENGIDFDPYTGIATSIVASSGFPEKWSLTLADGVLIYTGMGGSSGRNKGEPNDQKMVKGNLGLKKSMERKSPVRVIYGNKELKKKTATAFFYDGLYLVNDWRKVIGNNDCFELEFRLKRMEGQPKNMEWEAMFKKMVYMSEDRRRKRSKKRSSAK